MPCHVSKFIVQCFVIVLCTFAAFANGSAQRVRKPTVEPPDPKPVIRTRERKRPRPPVISTTPATTESDNFFQLGERFRKERKWNAAEAAYKEAFNVWPGNAAAMLELGYLYVDRNKFPEAQSMVSKLRSVDSSLAAELLTDINWRKTNSR